MSTSGGYHEYIGGYSVHRRDIMMNVGDTMSTSGDVQYVGGISWYMWGSNLIKSFQFLLKTPMYWTSPNVLNIPQCSHDILPMYSWYPPDVLMVFPRCTEHPPMYSWYPPTCIMISPRCAEHPPMYSWYPPDVLMVSLRCTEHLPMYSWYPSAVLNTSDTLMISPDVLVISPDVLMVSPQCTEHPLMYWTSPDVLSTHYTGCLFPQNVRCVYGDFWQGRCRCSIHKRLLFYFVIKVWPRTKDCWKMQYFQLKNEYHQWKGLEKLSKRHVSVITIAGIPLEIWCSKVFKNAESAFFKNFKTPYLQTDSGNIDNIYIFSSVFMGYLMVVFIFNSKCFIFQHFFFFGQTFRTKENNSVLRNTVPLPETTSTLPKVSIHVSNMLRQ